MKFLHPEFLYALFALAIPVIIHLFNFRRYKKVKFTNVAFLREVRERTQSSQKVKHLLVLLSRMLLLAFLVMAFAQPIIPRQDVAELEAEKSVSIFVDNSFSMQAENAEGPLLLQAISKARAVAQSYPATANFQLLTHSFSGSNQRFTTQEDFLERLEEVEIVPQSRNLSEIISRQRDLLSSAENTDQHLYIVSDFQQHMCDFASLQSDSSVQMHFLPIDIQIAENVYIDSLWFNTPFHNLNQQEKLNIRIHNHAEKSAQDLPMNMHLNGAQAAIGTYFTTPHNATDTSLFFNNNQPGIQQGYVDIDDYPITYDDRYYFSFSVDSVLKVLEISADRTAASYFAKIFDEDPQYEFTSSDVRNIDYAALSSRHFIILNELNDLSSGLQSELEEFISHGGSVFLVPGLSIDGNNLNSFLQRFQGPAYTRVVETESRVNEIDTDAPFYANLFERIPGNMDLPTVLSYYQLSGRVTGKDQSLMTLRTGDPFLSYVPHGAGRLYVSAVPLSTDKNNFARHAIFVASVLRMSEFSRPSTPLSYNLGDDIAISTGKNLPQGDQVFKITDTEGKFEIIPEFNYLDGKGYLFAHDQISEAGNYLIHLGDKPVMGVAFNYPRSESALNYYRASQLRTELDNRGIPNTTIIEESGDALEASLINLESGEKLWKLFLMVAIAFLIIETLLLKFWKQ